MAFFAKIISFLKPILNINIFLVFGIALYFFYAKIEYNKLESRNQELNSHLGELREDMLKEQQKLLDFVKSENEKDIKLVSDINKQAIKNIKQTESIKQKLPKTDDKLDEQTLNFIKELYATP